MDMTAGRLCPGARASCLVAQNRAKTTTRRFARKNVRIAAATGETPARTLVRPPDEELQKPLQQPRNGLPAAANGWGSSFTAGNDLGRQVVPPGVPQASPLLPSGGYATVNSSGPAAGAFTVATGSAVGQPSTPATTTAQPVVTGLRPPAPTIWPGLAVPTAPPMARPGVAPASNPAAMPVPTALPMARPGVAPASNPAAMPPRQMPNQPAVQPLSPPPPPPPQGTWPAPNGYKPAGIPPPTMQPSPLMNRSAGPAPAAPQQMRPVSAGVAAPQRPPGLPVTPLAPPGMPGLGPPAGAVPKFPVQPVMPGAAQVRPMGVNPSVNPSSPNMPAVYPAGQLPGSMAPPRPAQAQPVMPTWSQMPVTSSPPTTMPPPTAPGAAPLQNRAPAARPGPPAFGQPFNPTPSLSAAAPVALNPLSIPAVPPSPPTPTPPAGMLVKPDLRRPEPPTLMQKPAMRRLDVPAQLPPRLPIVVQPSLPEIKPELPRLQVPAAAPLQMPRPQGLVAPNAASVAPAAPGVEVAAEAPKPFKIEFVQEEEDLEYKGEEDEESSAKGKKGKKGKKTKEEEEVKGGRQKITAEMKREARKQRKEDREAKKVVRDKEEIFEVGEEGMSVGELADMLQVNEADVIMNLFSHGITCTANSQLDKNTVKVVAKDYEVLVLDKAGSSVSDLAKKRGNELVEEDDLDSLVPRPPVVTVMGHVDHGKTSLLDFIRKTRVASGEAGGITQQIGAYTTEVQADGGTRLICFLDTPGHEAFSAMRARGARITDIAIIIVAADDGLQPQTREAISHAQAAEVPIVVAINKIDKAGADVERTKQQLLECNLVPEEWGGKTPMVALSAKSGKGVDDLLLTLLLMAEEMQLVANPDRSAKGTVIEANLDKKSGAVATLLVQAGTLRPGDIVQAGSCYGKVRQLLSHTGKAQKAASPGMAVQMLGLSAVPNAGDTFEVWRSEALARMRAEEIAESQREQRIALASGGGSMVTLSSLATLDDDVTPGGSAGDLQQKLNLIIKGDTQGVVEAIKSALSGLPQEGVLLRYLWAGAGDVTQADLDLAAASNGLLLAFNLQPNESVMTTAKERGVQLRTYKVIYDLLDDVRAAMEGKLAPVEEKIELGRAEVKAVFGSGSRRAAGCGVLDGRLRKGCVLVVRRKKEKVYEGVLTSLKRIKENVEEVSAGLECGVACDGYTEWQEGDMIEAFEMISKNRKLEDVKARTAVDMATILA